MTPVWIFVFISLNKWFGMFAYTLLVKYKTTSYFYTVVSLIIYYMYSFIIFLMSMEIVLFFYTPL